MADFSILGIPSEKQFREVKLGVHRLSLSLFGFEVRLDSSLPTSVFRLQNADGSGVEYNAETKTWKML